MKQPKQFKRYIPIPLKNELDKLTFKRKDDLYVILDLIHRKEIYFKSDYQNRYGFTQISQSQFKQLIPSSDNLNRGIQFLVDNNLLLRNDFHIIGVQPKGYKIPKEYLGKTIPLSIEDKNINKRIGEQIKKNKRVKVKNLEFAKTDYYKTFRVDIDGANKAILDRAVTDIKKLCFNINVSLADSDILDIIECKEDHERKRMSILLHKNGNELDNVIHRYMVYSTRINAINDGFLFFKRNKTNGRLDSNLTSLPSFLRPFLLSSEKLMNLDIKNSQPYFLFTLLIKNAEVNKDELERYSELVINGTLYEYLVEQFKLQTGKDRERNQMKNILYKIFFSKVRSFAPYKTVFRKLFPSIMEFIDNTNSDQHNTLALQLQSKESFTILDIIMPLLEQKKIRPYTIHDSFVCKESEAKIIKELFVDKLTELYGVAPSLHMDYLIPNEEDEIITDFDEFIDDLNSQYEI